MRRNQIVSIALSIYQVPVTIAAFFLVCMSVSCTGPDKSVPNYEPAYAKDSSSNKIIILGLPSLSFYERYVDFCHYLNKRLPENIRIQVVATNTLSAYIEKFLKKEFSISLINGEIAVLGSKNGYTIVGKLSEDNGYRGLVITRKNVLVQKVADLKGKTIVCPGPDALAGTKMPLYYLATHGLDLNKDISITHVASFESVYMNVYLHKSYAGTTWLSAWKNFTQTKPEIAKALTPQFITEPLPNVALVIRSDIRAEVREKLLDLIFNMNKDTEGKKILSGIGTTAFQKANAASYKEVAVFLDKYRKIAPVSTP